MDTVGYYLSDYKLNDLKAVALEDNIMHKGHPVTAGSKILENFIAPFDATVVTRLLDKGFVISGKTEMAEFGISGIFTDERGEGKISGAVRAVADNAVSYALAADIFGTCRREAAAQGLCYIYPSYGTVSRFGLIPLVSSMDQIGVICRNPGDGFGLLSVIAGKDPKDGAMFPGAGYSYAKSEKKPVIAVPDNIDSSGIEGFVKNFSCVKIHLKYFDLYQQLMCVLSGAEISGNLSRYDGIKFGRRAEGYKNLEELYRKTRTEGFGFGAALAAITGSMVLSRDQYGPYYEKAMKIRRLVKEFFIFDNYDLIALPSGGNQGDSAALYAISPLAGLPSISFAHNGKAVQLIAGVKNESVLYTALEAAGS